MNTPKILDACCGGRMFYFDKQSPQTIFCDNRHEAHILCDGRKFSISPDILADFRQLPFQDNQFSLVIFDPPHFEKAGKNGWQAKKYGVLPDKWEGYIQQGFSECWRVLKPQGTLIFKWSENQIKRSEVLKLAPNKPLMGHTGHNALTHWYVFFKE